MPEKTFRERNPGALGVVGAIVVVVLLVTAFNAHAVIRRFATYDLEAVFTEAGGLKPGDDVRVAGRPVGTVTSVGLDHTAVLVKLQVDKGVHLQNQTRAQVKTATALGTKYVALIPAGTGELKGRIPLSRTKSAYDITQALAQLTTTADALNSKQLAGALNEVYDTFDKTPTEFARALDGVKGLSDIIAERDEDLQTVLHRAAVVTNVLEQRQGQVEQIIVDGNLLATELTSQKVAIDTLFQRISDLTTQLQGLVREGNKHLRPALVELRGALKLLNANRKNLEQILERLPPFARSLGETLGSGPFFEAYVGNFTPDGFPVFPDQK